MKGARIIGTQGQCFSKLKCVRIILPSCSNIASDAVGPGKTQDCFAKALGEADAQL